MVFCRHPAVFILGFATLSASATALALLLFVFGVTYYPFAKPPKTSQDLVLAKTGNVADAATFDFIRHIGPYAKKPTAESLKEAVNMLFTNQHGAELLKRLDLDEQSVIQAIYANILPELEWNGFADLVLKITSSMRRIIYFN